MNIEVENCDINDAFNAIAFSEDRIAREAFVDGFKKGESDGYKEGYHLGYHRGIELGRELGFYRGVLSATSENENCSGRVQSVKERLLGILRRVPTANDNECDFLEFVNNVRALFKQYVSLLKLTLEIPAYNSQSF